MTQLLRDLQTITHAIASFVWDEDSDTWFDLMDSRLQLAVVPFSFGRDPVWAYFPVHRRRRIAKFVELKPETRVLLVIFEPDLEDLPYDETLKKLRHHIGHVLRYLRGPKLKPLNDVRRSWERALEDAKLPKFVLYNLRHSYASRLSAAGVSDLFVAQMIGHASPSILQIYSKAIDEYRRDAVRKLEDMRTAHSSWRNAPPTLIN